MKKIIVAFAAVAAGMICMDLHAQDWANFGAYSNANKEVKTKPAAVFMGDSITEGCAGFFEDNGFLCRGISGQTTSHMLVRFRNDVLNLSPKIPYVDFHSVLADNGGGLPAKYAADGVHPNIGCYKIMESVLLPYMK